MKKYIMSFSVLMVAIVAMAFTKVDAPKERVVNQYLFTGTLSQVSDPLKWTQSTAALPSCRQGQVPCYVLTDMSIEDWLDGKTDAQIIAGADARKN